MNYGLPYQGSKNSMARELVGMLPPAETFVDVFAGGCSMTHCAMLSGKWRKFIANDIRGDIPRLFADAVAGKYSDEKRWISREDFSRLRDEDAYVRVCWSFGNDLRTYLYSREIEPYKRALHYAVVFDDWAEFRALCPEVAGGCEERLSGIADTKRRRIEIGRAVVGWLKANGTLEMVLGNPLYKSCHLKSGKGRGQSLQSLESLERLQSLQSLESLERLQSLQSQERLERLQRLESLQRLQRLEITCKDFREIELPEDATIYADPPYLGVNLLYGKGFDHKPFYEWLRNVGRPVYVSEYTMPDDFVCIWEHKRRSLCPSNFVKLVVERLFLHEKWADKHLNNTFF